jgi:hypothetical protein
MIEDPWLVGQETTLLLHLRPPFTTFARLQTALTRKFVHVSFQANCNVEECGFALRNHQIKLQNDVAASGKAIAFKSINPPSEVMVNILLLGNFADRNSHISNATSASIEGSCNS